MRTVQDVLARRNVIVHRMQGNLCPPHPAERENAQSYPMCLELGVPGNTAKITAFVQVIVDPLREDENARATHPDFRYRAEHLCTAANDGNGIMYRALLSTFKRACADYIKVVVAVIFTIPIVPNKVRLSNDRISDRGGIITSTEKIAEQFAPNLTWLQARRVGTGFVPYRVEAEDVPDIEMPCGLNAIKNLRLLIEHKALPHPESARMKQRNGHLTNNTIVAHALRMYTA